MEDKGIKYAITKEIALLSEKSSGWTKELNIINWNERGDKFDIREWAPNREKLGKGVTLTEDEMDKLVTEYLEYKKSLPKKTVKDEA